MRALRDACLALTAAAALLGGGAAAAGAHVQVAPESAAPNDAVRFTVLVPGERAPKRTTKVVLKVPQGVLPYSFEATPGWSRRLIEAPDHSVDRIAWSGDLAPDGFVELSFLASTPPKPATLEWKALQYYSDGDVVRWIGPPSSENPAPRTEVRAGLAPQNAGGEGTGGEGEAASAAAPAAGDSGGDADWLARALALAAVLLALFVAARPSRRPTGLKQTHMVGNRPVDRGEG